MPPAPSPQLSTTPSAAASPGADSIAAVAQARPMTGAALTACRRFLALSAARLAEFTACPASQITDLEAAGAEVYVPQHLADNVTEQVLEALDVMKPAELRGQRDLLALDLPELAAAIRVKQVRLRYAEDGQQMINEHMRDSLHVLLEQVEQRVRAVAEHLRSHASEAQTTVVMTYRNIDDLTAAQRQLPPLAGDESVSGFQVKATASVGHHTDAGEDPVTALLRNSPSPTYHRRIATRAALIAGARLRYA